MGMRVLVTGGAGFIGSHVSQALLERGDDVVCLDSLDDYYAPSLKRRNLVLVREVAERKRRQYTFVEGDIRDTELLAALGRREGFGAIVHLAARAGVRPSIEQAPLYADVNVTGTVRLLELARAFGVRNFVFASSSSVYGERTNVPFRESDPVDHPVSPYAATKKAGELLCSTYQQLFDLDTTCLRFFTVYGPRQRPEMAIAHFTRLLASGKTVPLFAGGSGRRDFTFIDDIVDGVLRALDRNEGYSIYNLGNHRMVTTKELVETIAHALGVEPSVELLANQPGDVSTTCASLEHSQKGLGYEPRIELSEGIAKYVEWYRTEKVGRS
ncbi:MAG: NAD-dependent epimerase/dehydratase family protein [Planctomycetota bacterium]